MGPLSFAYHFAFRSAGGLAYVAVFFFSLLVVKQCESVWVTSFGVVWRGSGVVLCWVWEGAVWYDGGCGSFFSWWVIDMNVKTYRSSVVRTICEEGFLLSCSVSLLFFRWVVETKKRAV